MATHSSTPAWRIPWTEKPGGLQFLLWQLKENKPIDPPVCSQLTQSRTGPHAVWEVPCNICWVGSLTAMFSWVGP